MTTEKKDPIDWELIERHYRAGIKSLREMATDAGVSEGAIRKRAKRDQWTRNLSAKIKAKADDLVRTAEVRTPSTQLTPSTEKQVIDDNAQVQANVRIRQRSDIGSTSDLFRALLAELKAETGSIALFESLGELLDESGPDQTGTWRKDKLNEIYKKVISSTGRIDGAKKLTEMLEKLVKLERQAFGIEDGEGEKPGVEDLLKRIGEKVANG